MRRIAVALRATARLVLGITFLMLAHPPATSAARGPLKEAEIVLLLQSGVSTRRVEALVARHGIAFAATPASLDVIRASGGDESLLRALKTANVIDPSSSPTPPRAAASAPRNPEIEPELVLIQDGPSGDYFISRFEITNGQYLTYCKQAGAASPKAPYWGTPSRLPVVNVSWHEAVAYARWLTHATGRVYRLPGELEWEYAARGGGRIKTYPWGEASPVGRCCFGTGRLCPVGSFAPNALGIYDTSGSVYEWCRDSFARKGPDRVIRGGGWSIPVGNPELLAITRREGLNPDKRRNDVGFRVVREAS